MRFQNGSNKVVIELRLMQFWSEIIHVISNRTLAVCLFNFEITHMISDQIAFHSAQLPLRTYCNSMPNGGYHAYYPLNLFRNMHNFESWAILLDIPQF